MSINTLKLYLNHEGKNHRAALSFIIVKPVQGISDLGIDKAPFGSPGTTMVKDFSQ